MKIDVWVSKVDTHGGMARALERLTIKFTDDLSTKLTDTFGPSPRFLADACNDLLLVYPHDEGYALLPDTSQKGWLKIEMTELGAPAIKHIVPGFGMEQFEAELRAGDKPFLELVLPAPEKRLKPRQFWHKEGNRGGTRKDQGKRMPVVAPPRITTEELVNCAAALDGQLVSFVLTAEQLARARAGKALALRETQSSISTWGKETFGVGPGYNVLGILTRMNVEVAELLSFASHFDTLTLEEKTKLGEEMADVLVVLYQGAEAAGVDLLKEVDDKMHVNRNRTWKRTASGRHQHATDPREVEVVVGPTDIMIRDISFVDEILEGQS